MLMKARTTPVVLPQMTCRRCPPRLDGKQCIDPRHVCLICAGIGLNNDYTVCTHPGVEAANVATLPRRDKHVPEGIWDKKTAKKKGKGGKPVAKNEDETPEERKARKKAKKAKKEAKAAAEAAQSLDLDVLEPDDDVPADATSGEGDTEPDETEPAEPADEDDADEADADEADSSGDDPYGDGAEDEDDYNPKNLREVISTQDMPWDIFLKHVKGSHTELFDKLKQPAEKHSLAAQRSSRALHYRLHNANVVDEGAEHVHVPHDKD
jgi:hypothetical protein